jgi:predicted  nucleic acid-binding Zn-ribbon protein
MELYDMMSLYEILGLAGALIGIYVKLQNDLTRVKNRVYVLEQSKDEVKDLIKQMMNDIHEIKLLLARKQIDS